MLTLMYVLPWIFVVIAVVITLGSAVLGGSRGRASAARATTWYRALGSRLRTHLRYRAFDRALAEFRRNAQVCAEETLDDTVGIPRE